MSINKNAKWLLKHTWKNRTRRSAFAQARARLQLADMAKKQKMGKDGDINI